MFRTNHRLLVILAITLAACGTGLDFGDEGPVSTTSPDATTTTVPDVTTTTPDVTTTTTVVPTTTTVVDDPPATDDVEVMIFLVGGPDVNQDDYDCGAVSPVIRYVESPAVLTGAMEALLAGPTADELDEGYDSWFNEETGWTLASVMNIVDGVAYIDFSEDSPFINNASTSCGSFSFLAQLDETATQFPTVDHAVYSIGGDARVFYEWLQRDVPEF